MGTGIYSVLILILFQAVSPAESKQSSSGMGATPVIYGSAAVERIIAVDDCYSFRCDVKDWPAIIGRDIIVRIDRLGPPDIVEKGGKPNIFFQQQSRAFLENVLNPKDEKNITLENIQRGRSFWIIAEVIVDGNSLADLLVKEGFARRCTAEEMLKLYLVQNQDQDESAGPAAGASSANTTAKEQTVAPAQGGFVASRTGKTFHRAACSHAKRITESNIVKFDTREKAIQTGRSPCKTCNP